MAKKQVAVQKNNEVKATWGVLCTMSSIDVQSNNISLLNVINQLNINSTEFARAKSEGSKGIRVANKHELVIMFKRLGVQGIDKKELRADVKVSLFSPKGELITEMLSPLIFIPKAETHGHRIYMDEFLVQEPGNYEYRIYIQEESAEEFKHLYTVPLLVVSTPNQGTH